jgi:hypothetical protein
LPSPHPRPHNGDLIARPAPHCATCRRHPL